MTSTQKSKKFSDLITELVHMWIGWVKYNDITKNESFTIKVRAEACDKCEDLIRREYEIVSQLDSYFIKND